MKHGVVVASPRAGITRDKYSANKSSHHPPRRTRPRPPSSPFLPLLSRRYLQNVARGWSARPPAIFNKSSRVLHRRWPPASMPWGRGRVGWRWQGHIRCIRRAFYFVPRARARMCTLSLPLFFFLAFFPFLRLFYATARFFSPFLVDAGLLGNYQSGSSDRKYPAHPSPFATCVRGVPAATPPLISASLPPSSVPGYPSPPSPYVHWPICSIKALDWLAWQRGHGSFFRARNLPW